MPLVNFQNPASSISGKIGEDNNAIVYYVQEGRGICRKFTIPIQPNSTYQQQIRSIFSSIAALYTTLSPSQIIDWNPLL